MTNSHECCGLGHNGPGAQGEKPCVYRDCLSGDLLESTRSVGRYCEARMVNVQFKLRELTADRFCHER
jgi:hypothetical protein